MAELRSLKIKRGKIKARLERFSEYVAKDTVCVDELQERLKKSEELWDQFTEVQLELSLLSDSLEDNSQDESEEIAFEKAYYSSVGKARKLLRPPVECQRKQDESMTSAPTESDIKLPPMNLPTFEGKYNQWLTFKDLFSAVIDANGRLSDVQKFQYLRGCLKGEALLVLQGLETSSENYKVAWDLLQGRYENKKLIVNTHMKELFELTHVAKENHQSLRTFIDCARTHLRALKSLGQPVDQWDTVLIYLLQHKLDVSIRKDWEMTVAKRGNHEMPTIDEMMQFLTCKCHTLEMIEKSVVKQETPRSTAAKKENKLSFNVITQRQCKYCKGSHPLYQCERFLKLSTKKRCEEVKRLRLCLNCLREGHLSTNCLSSKCKHCNKTHNTLLHYNDRKVQDQENTKEDVSVVVHCGKSKSQVILATALIYIYDKQGGMHKCRALLDPGSQSNIVTQKLAKKLGVTSNKSNITVIGVNQSRVNNLETACIRIKSVVSGFTSTLDCIIMPSITQRLPQIQIDTSAVQFPTHIKLADITFHKPGPIDVLIGASLFWDLLDQERIKISNKFPVLQKTKLGWVVGGEMINCKQNSTSSYCNFITTSSLQQQLEKFWNVEELNEKKHLSVEEEECEKQFQNSVCRDKNGRFSVGLPQRASVELGNSKLSALRRFYNLERKLNSQPELRQQYREFMVKYEELGHMTKMTNENGLTSNKHFYLPHRAVTRSDHLSTKVRVVFDGSAKTTNGVSLNEKLLVGPNIQNELIDILLRFRSHEFVITADIEMMYRQIVVQTKDRDLQRIFWRFDHTHDLDEYRLNTVTYGTSCAPYLAVRCLKQLAIDEAEQFPWATSVLNRDFYMDDVLSGASTLEQAIKLQKQLTELLHKGQFNLRKWRANDTRILNHLESNNKATDLLTIDKEIVKTLGVYWNAKTDMFHYQVNFNCEGEITKRSILSCIARIYDPLGLIGPIIVLAKLIMQSLWQCKLDWSDQVPMSLQIRWQDYYNSLTSLDQLSVKRNINPSNITGNIILNGFSDASEKAYGACVYATSVDSSGRASTHLICSKSRVAPLKTISLPRLELCAAQLLSKLILTVWRAYDGKIIKTHLWTDSTIVLSWINAQPNLLKTFVANRVSEIQSNSQGANWYHVPSADNPADILSRGMRPKELINNKLWWQGPQWIPFEDQWPNQFYENVEVPEVKTVLLINIEKNDILRKYSSFIKLQRVIATCIRFAALAKGKQVSGAFSVMELQTATKAIVRLVQSEEFYTEIQQLKKYQTVKARSKLHTLKPFLDEEGLLRVTGRLQNADILISQKQPLILPARHHVTHLIMRAEHIRLHHCGTEQLLSSIRQTYWPLSGRREAKKVVHACLKCWKLKPKSLEPVMADLPKSRVTEMKRPYVQMVWITQGLLKLRKAIGEEEFISIRPT